jgi:phage gp29-like protein
VWWKLKYQLPNQIRRFTQIYSLPLLALIMGERPAGGRPLNPDGTVDTAGAEESAIDQAAETLQSVQAGYGGVFGHGSDLKTVESKGNGEAFEKLVGLLDRQAVYGILGNTRTTMEAENGSKADSQSGQDVSAVVGMLLKLMVRDAIRDDLAWDALAKNFGEEYADKYCPDVHAGTVEKQDLSAIGPVIVALINAGAIKPSQVPAVLAWLGIKLPPATEDPDEPLPGEQVAESATSGNEKAPADPRKDRPGQGQGGPSGE